jgi:ornithine cyclodeaminase
MSSTVEKGMNEILLITESELRQCVSLNRETIDVIDQAFARLNQGGVIMPPVLSMELPQVNGEVDVKTAYIPGLDSFTIKISPGFFDNPLKGLPSLNGLMVTFAADTGLVKAILLDNGYLTDVRTAAAGGVAARHLAPKQPTTAGIIGAGVQARLQARALLLERDIKRLLVWARDPQKAKQYAEEQTRELQVSVETADSIEQLMQESQLVVTTTPAKEPILKAGWLHPGLHITAMGSDSPEKNELDPEILDRADRLIVDRISQSLERGEMRSAVKAGIMSIQNKAKELGELCSGHISGRQSDQDITVCDLTGTGIQDTAIADYAVRTARDLGLGTLIKA